MTGWLLIPLSVLVAVWAWRGIRRQVALLETADRLADIGTDEPDPEWIDRLRETVVDEARRGGFVRPSAQDEINDLDYCFGLPAYKRETR